MVNERTHLYYPIIGPKIDEIPITNRPKKTLTQEEPNLSKISPYERTFTSRNIFKTFLQELILRTKNEEPLPTRLDH